MLTTLLALSLLALPATGDEASRRQAQEHLRAGQQLMSAESFDDAIVEFKKAIALDPMLFMAHYNLGQSHMALKGYVEAGFAFEASKEAFLRATQLGEKERFERDRAVADEMTELRRSIESIRSGQIKAQQPEMMILRLESRMNVLQGMMGKGLEAASVPAEVHLAIGSAYFRQNKLAEAEAAYAQAVRQNNKLGAAHNNLAVIYMLSGRYKEAHAAIKSAEKAGFQVPPGLKVDLDKREASSKGN